MSLMVARDEEHASNVFTQPTTSRRPSRASVSGLPPDLGTPKRTIRERIADLVVMNFATTEEELFFQSYYYQFFLKQLRLAMAFAWLMFLVGSIVDYSTTQNSANYVNGYIGKPQLADNLIPRFAIRMCFLGILLVSFIFSFSKYFRYVWKLYTIALAIGGMLIYCTLAVITFQCRDHFHVNVEFHARNSARAYNHSSPCYLPH